MAGGAHTPMTDPASDHAADPEPTPVTGRIGRVTVSPPDADGVVHVRISPSLTRSLVTIGAETLFGFTLAGVITFFARILDNPGLTQLLPAWWAAGAFLPLLATADTLAFGQNERLFVGASTLAVRPPLGDWYVLRRMAALHSRYEPLEQPWWASSAELGQQGAGVVLIGPRAVGIRTGNALSKVEADRVLAAIASVPVDLGVHREVGPSTREVGLRIAVGVAIAVIAFALIFPGMADLSQRWRVGVGYLLLLWVAYRFWFNLFRRRPEYAQ
jgi:uncharacterized membrane protein